MSPKTRSSLHIFSHLARGLRIPLRSSAIRLSPVPSYSSFSTRHVSSPEGNQRKSSAFTLCDKQSVNCSTHQQTVCVQAIMLDESCLLCSNVQMCTSASQICIHSPTFPVCVSTVEVRDANGVPCVQSATCFSCHAARDAGHTSNRGRRVKLLSQQLLHNKNSLSTASVFELSLTSPCLSCSRYSPRSTVLQLHCTRSSQCKDAMT